MSAGLDHVSFTQINMWLRCQMQYYWRYVMDLKQPPSAAMAFGSCSHSTLEFNFGQKVHSKTDLPVEQVVSAFADAWEDKNRNEELVYDQEKGETAAGFLDIGTQLIDRYQREIAIDMQPIAVEYPITIPTGVDGVDLVGYLDFAGSFAETRRIVDYKASARKPPAFGFDLQSMLMLIGYGDPSYAFEYHYLLKKKEPAIYISPRLDLGGTDRVSFTKNLVKNATMQIMDAIDTGVFVPNPTHPWACTEKQCGYYRNCFPIRK